MGSDHASAGQALVDLLTGALGQAGTWDEREQALLDLAARQADDIDTLEQLLATQGPTVKGSTGQPKLSPVYAELRQQRLALARIIAEVRVPSGEGQVAPTRQAVAAITRWDRERRKRDERQRRLRQGA